MAIIQIITKSIADLVEIKILETNFVIYYYFLEISEFYVTTAQKKTKFP